MDRSELTYHRSPRFVLKSSNIKRYIDILIGDYKFHGDEQAGSPLLVVLDGFTVASEKQSQVRTFLMEEPGIEFFNWYMNLHKVFVQVMLEDKFRTYNLSNYEIYVYNKLLMIEGRIYTLDQIKGFIDHYTKYDIVQAPIEPIEDMSVFKIGCITVSIQDIRKLVAFAEKEGDL